MLKKFQNDCSHFLPGTPLFLVTREGVILEGFTISDSLGRLVSLNKPPLPGSEKQGFTIEGELLKPNWCEGKRTFIAACLTREEAELLATPVLERLARKKKKEEACNEEA